MLILQYISKLFVRFVEEFCALLAVIFVFIIFP